MLMRNQLIPCPVGEIRLRVTLDGELFGDPSAAPVLEELLDWTTGSIRDNLAPRLTDLVQSADLPERETVVESDSSLTIDGNKFGLIVETTLYKQIPERAIRAIIHQCITGDAANQFIDIVSAKLAEGSLPHYMRFRSLMPA